MKNNLITSLKTVNNLAVKATKKYGVAVLATTAALVVYTKVTDKSEDETNESDINV